MRKLVSASLDHMIRVEKASIVACPAPCMPRCIQGHDIATSGGVAALWARFRRHADLSEALSRYVFACRAYLETAANNGDCISPWNCLSSALKCICRFELSEFTDTFSRASFSTGVADIFL